MKKIKKILIANRGEIASRIIKTCREMKIDTVAIYSEHDLYAPYVSQADESYSLGNGNATETYLNADKIVDIALQSKADAIHPGYGFLSENSAFAKLILDNELTFIGPSPEAMVKLGNKIAARVIAQSLLIPITIGTTEPLESLEEAKRIASQTQYPILLKAAGGGGGKGMRIVRDESELALAFRTAQSEAKSSFGDSRIYIEKYLHCPKHIEVQILADQYGNVVHLGERECSVQRRYQKIIEESPSIAINEKIRENLTQAAVKLVRHVGYVGAGTVEFLLDKDSNYYFLEVNTRLQVEHPVTEMRTGLDLVQEQIYIAEGKHLTFTQNEIEFKGHAIECRLYAENPMDNFQPSTGTVVFHRSPAGFGIREDIGFQEGYNVTPYYDPLLSKLIAWGETREQALDRISIALLNYRFYGVRNNLKLCRWIIDNKQFRDGTYHTKFLDESLDKFTSSEISDEVRVTAGISAVLQHEQASKQIKVNSAPESSAWKKSRREYLR